MAFLPTVPPRSTTTGPTRFSTPRIDFSGSQGMSEVGEGFGLEVNSRSFSAIGGIFREPMVRPATSCLLPSSSYRKPPRTVANQSVVSRNSSAVGSSSGLKFRTLPFSAVNKSFGGFLCADVEGKLLETGDPSLSVETLLRSRAEENGLVLPRWLPKEEGVWNNTVCFDQSSLENTVSLSLRQRPMTLAILDVDHETSGYLEKDKEDKLWNDRNGPENKLDNVNQRLMNLSETIDDISSTSLTSAKALVTEKKNAQQLTQQLTNRTGLSCVSYDDRQTRNWNYTMDALLKGGKARECLDMFLSMPSNEVKRDVASWSIYITALGRLERYSEAERSLIWMREEHIQPNIYTYSALIETLGKGGLCVRALSQFRRMSRIDNIAPNTVTYNAVIKIVSRCKRNDCGGITRAMSLLREMATKGCIPDVVTYATLIDAFSKRMEPERALKLFQEMKEANVKPNNYCYSSLISAFCRAGYVERALAIFEEMTHERIVPDVFAFNALIDGFGKLRQVDKAFEIYDRMRKLQIQPDRITFNALISASGKAKNSIRALEAMGDMTEIYGLTPDRHSYNALIDACGKSGDFTKAYEVFEEMRTKGIRPCTVTFNALIYGASRSHDLAASFKIVDLMLQEGLNPDAYTMNTLISACNRRQDLSTAFEVLEKFKQLGVHPDNVTFNTFIDAVGKLDSSEKMFELLSEMESRGISPSKVTLNTIVGCCGRRGKIDLMERGFHMFHEKRLEPDSVTFSLLIENYVSHHLLDKAVIAYHNCKRQQLELNSNVVMHLLESLIRKDEIEVAKLILKDYPFLMRHFSLEDDRQTTRSRRK
ncbi:Pentatricopeptide repeat-containing protein [Galdieria sulphuraria]|uniref:Mitochondrial protein translocase, MPT family n=1 Tax=Galdieria sulphuraria TaxID=130081 RepID=M2Y9N8_GALSU|nr:mitochondrial protein translocase, MPT family [Galdieria sulphuraria]EME32788.1 mitochondrial protein translocase, MPT family [Galdieria sulphuraria]GJD12661.1 Pentatricopeptide repeat-containing protein [Galdieria sulphuraria]|eukprot:XP_005709308.1 mitochondrial protein translocase, MPT family [Galdieria sulphuraria]